MYLRGEPLFAFLVACSFAAELNLYATAATLGLLARAGLVGEPPALLLLRSSWVILPALALFMVEFFADKIPGFDLIWNALHTFVRVPAAALLTYAATSHLPASQQAFSTAALAHIRRMSSTVAPPPLNPVEVFTKSAPAATPN